ncbi:ATP-binding protein [Streptomyces sp. NPDC002262]|uniref:ATP-binding protein n=1 Tax=Streptomyces sp. NPDC002262 TaxID=3154414 RepID=UPI00332EDB0B
MGADADPGGGSESLLDRFLMRAGHVLDGGGSCVAEARRHASAFLDRARTEHRLPVSPRARDLTVLVVSELVTNACKYAPGPVLMELRIRDDSVDIVVRDGNPAVPAARAADPRRIGQHGLEIVEAVSEELLIEQEPLGKRVTARLALSGASGPA